ncbi:MAG: prolyl 4-hydroxylase, partial [Paraburkholderia sp.]|nr:prolyl 4-hydroxylase [Paraburkholderia sp.]
AMIQAGFDHAAAQAAVHESTAKKESTDSTGAVTADGTPGEYGYDTSPVATGNVIKAGDKHVNVLARYARPEVILFGNVLTDDECDEMIERSRNRLRPSTVVNLETGADDIITSRTSQGISFDRGEDELIARIERRFAELMNCPVDHGEGLQILNYAVDGKYLPHFDYFPPGRAGSNVHFGRGGQRVATLIAYLNDVPAGGETVFPEIGMSVAPRRGNAVYFRYMNRAGQLDPSTLHGGAPVTQGEKWIMTKWVRERTYG